MSKLIPFSLTFRSLQPHCVWFVKRIFSTFGLCLTRRFLCPFCICKVMVIKYSSTVCISIASQMLLRSWQHPVRSLHRWRTVALGMYTFEGSVLLTGTMVGWGVWQAPSERTRAPWSNAFAYSSANAERFWLAKAMPLKLMTMMLNRMNRTATEYWRCWSCWWPGLVVAATNRDIVVYSLRWHWRTEWCKWEWWLDWRTIKDHCSKGMMRRSWTQVTTLDRSRLRWDRWRLNTMGCSSKWFYSCCEIKTNLADLLSLNWFENCGQLSCLSLLSILHRPQWATSGRWLGKSFQPATESHLLQASLAANWISPYILPVAAVVASSSRNQQTNLWNEGNKKKERKRVRKVAHHTPHYWFAIMGKVDHWSPLPLLRMIISSSHSANGHQTKLHVNLWINWRAPIPKHVY